MVDNLLSLQISEHAEIQYSSLRAGDRLLIDAWFDHLRNWRNDESIRSRSKRLDPADQVYALQTTDNWLIAFQLTESQVVVLSIFRKESLRSFEAAAVRSAS